MNTRQNCNSYTPRRQINNCNAQTAIDLEHKNGAMEPSKFSTVTNFSLLTTLHELCDPLKVPHDLTVIVIEHIFEMQKKAPGFH